MDEELLADLDDFGSSSPEDVSESEDVGSAAAVDTGAQSSGGRAVSDAAPISLRRTAKYQRVMESVRTSMADAKSHRFTLTQPIELDPQYNLLLEVNAMVHALAEERQSLYKWVATRYSRRFDELEQLVMDPIQYCKVVKIIGNEMNLTNVNLGAVLPPDQVMVVTVAASACKADALPQAELDAIVAACDEVLAIVADKATLLAFIEAFMAVLAPNVSALVGTAVAAELVALVGGMPNLAGTPSCNLHILGQAKKTIAGMSTANAGLHRGVLYGAPIIAQAPKALQQKTARVLSGKLALAARVDVSGTDPAGSSGHRWADEVKAKLEQWRAPPPGRTVKPLPKPKELTGKTRGGRKARALKAKLGLTAMRKETQRLAFGEAPTDFSEAAVGNSLGRMSQASAGALRIRKTDNAAAILGKKRRRTGVDPGRDAASGSLTSLAFSATQGMSFSNPDAGSAAAESGAKSTYFQPSGAFTAVRK